MSTALDDPTTVRRNPHRRALPTRNTQLLAGPSLAPHGKDRRATTGAVALTDRVAVARAQWRNAVVDSRPSRFSVELSAFVGFRFPPEVIALAVRSYLRFELSYRDL